MSWSLNAVGRPEAVKAKIAADASQNKCSEPEESIKQSAVAAICLAVGSYAPDTVVTVRASGSQYVDRSVVKYNQLSVSIEPVHGFTE